MSKNIVYTCKCGEKATMLFGSDDLPENWAEIAIRRSWESEGEESTVHLCAECAEKEPLLKGESK